VIAFELASAVLPTKFGELRICVLFVGDERAEHVAIVKGHVRDAEAVPTYIHVECLVGHVFGALTCGCRVRLDRALERLAQSELGVLVFVRAEPLPRSFDTEFATAVLEALGARSLVVQEDADE
jgi:GTP cyclohydrolase II